MNLHRFLLVTSLIIIFSFSGFGVDSLTLPKDIKYTFNVSMEHPGNHYFHVELTCTGQNSEFIDFKQRFSLKRLLVKTK